MPSNIAPYLTVDGAARAIEWYEKVLGARCSFQMPAENDDRIMHSTLIVRGNVFNLADAFPEVGGHPAPDMKAGSPVAIGLTLETPAEVDRIFALAIAEGGSQSHPPEEVLICIGYLSVEMLCSALRCILSAVRIKRRI